MLTFGEAVGEVRKTGQVKPKSRFPLRSPAWMNQRTNQESNDATRRKTPQQSKTKPLRPGEKEPEEYSDPYSELQAAAKALQKADPSLTDAMAFTRAYETRPDLRKRAYTGRMKGLGYDVGPDGRMRLAENVV
jgi:hypothetical protein